MSDLARLNTAIPAVRLRRLQEMLAEHGAVALHAAQAELGVSEMTIRRDFAQLEQLGLVERSWGGIVARRGLEPERGHAERVQSEPEAKATIAAFADDLIEEGETIFVSGGTSALALALRLARRSRLTILTTSLPALTALVDNPGLTVIAIGGRTSPYNNDTTGPEAETAIARYRADKAVVGVTGISADGLFNANLDRATTHRLMIENSRESLVLADHTKFGLSALTLVAPLLPTMTVITDTAPLPHVAAWFSDAGAGLVAPQAAAPRRRRRAAAAPVPPPANPQQRKRRTT